MLRKLKLSHDDIQFFLYHLTTVSIAVVHETT